tara:strand:- start:44 stop:517 length:474 start_codon:yes stop_codon:yes gene_type:complete
MLIQFQEYLTLSNIYLWATLGVLPFWLILIIIPNSNITKFLLNSILLPLIISGIYIYVIYQAFLLGEDFFEIFNLYLGLENLTVVFSTETFLLIFWLHFLILNILLGTWVSRDSLKYSIPKPFVILTLLMVYFVGPIGLVFYWFFRVFYAKRISLYD